MQDLLKSFPCELIEEGLKYSSREIGTGNRRLDLAFIDRRNRLLLIEVQKDSLDTKHIDRHIDFVEGYAEKNPDVDIRLMYIANRIDHLRKAFLEKRGYEYLEIPAIKFIELAKKHNMFEENTFEDNSPIEANVNTYKSNYESSINQDEMVKRQKFISSTGTKNEKEFWKLFFSEIDSRSFIKATFQVSEFGVHIHNKNHFNSSGGKYSLMFTRNDSFKMNDSTFQGRSWNGLNRLKNWCITPNLAEKFYSELKTKNLLIGETISIPTLLRSFTPTQLIEQLFKCLDLFS